MSEQDFIDAGYDAEYYSNVKYISFDEDQHVALLSAALTEAGVTPNEECEYSFGFDDVSYSLTIRGFQPILTITGCKLHHPFQRT